MDPQATVKASLIAFKVIEQLYGLYRTHVALAGSRLEGIAL